jgi:hypothetical protein
MLENSSITELVASQEGLSSKERTVNHCCSWKYGNNSLLLFGTTFIIIVIIINAVSVAN